MRAGNALNVPHFLKARSPQGLLRLMFKNNIKHGKEFEYFSLQYVAKDKMWYCWYKEEVKVKVAKRVPPGDRWTPLDNETVILDSLTDVLEYVYQKEGITQFYMDAREGYTYIIETEEKVVEPEPTKKWSLYGEE